MKVKDIVMVYNTNDSNLDGRVGEIVGIIKDFGNTKFCIVLFKEPYKEDGSTALVIIDSCLMKNF